MRYALALAMAFAIGIAAMVPAAYASDKVDPATYRNGQIVSQSPVPIYMASGSSAVSTVAGPQENLQNPYHEQRCENYGR